MTAKSDAAARNRALMPEFGQIAAEWKEIIPGTKVPHVCEGGITLGSEPVYTGTFVSTADMPSLDMVKE